MSPTVVLFELNFWDKVGGIVGVSECVLVHARMCMYLWVNVCVCALLGK